MNLREALREVLDGVAEWHFEDRGYDYNECRSCGWNTPSDRTPEAPLGHRPGCRLRQAMDFVEAFLAEPEAAKCPGGPLGHSPAMHGLGCEGCDAEHAQVFAKHVGHEEHEASEAVRARAEQPDLVVMYLVVRESLNMSPGKLAAQCGHAVGMLDRLYFRRRRTMDLGPDEHQSRSEHRRLEAMTEIDPDDMALFELWDRTSYRKVTLRADDKEWEKLKASGLRHVVVRDAGLTELEPGSETVIGLWPMFRSQAPRLVRRLRAL